MRQTSKPKLLFPFFLAGFFIVLATQASAITILIDPGHGGEDWGAHLEETRKSSEALPLLEKEVCMQLSLKIYEELKKNYTVFFTRSVDRTVTLDQRSEMAEKVNADLFISVHANSGPHKFSEGFETYYLDNHNDVAIKKMERVENPKLKGNDLIANQILIDLLIQRTAPSSRKLAYLVHASLKRKISIPFRMVDRGVKPGIFYVLALSKRPAILLEAGFISNPVEAKKLIDPAFQEAYAQAVSQGIKAYFNEKDQKELAQL